jgi:hypothetical protein
MEGADSLLSVAKQTVDFGHPLEHRSQVALQVVQGCADYIQLPRDELERISSLSDTRAAAAPTRRSPSSRAAVGKPSRLRFEITLTMTEADTDTDTIEKAPSCYVGKKSSGVNEFRRHLAVSAYLAHLERTRRIRDELCIPTALLVW